MGNFLLKFFRLIFFNVLWVSGKVQHKKKRENWKSHKILLQDTLVYNVRTFNLFAGLILVCSIEYSDIEDILNQWLVVENAFKEILGNHLCNKLLIGLSFSFNKNERKEKYQQIQFIKKRLIKVNFLSAQ